MFQDPQYREQVTQELYLFKAKLLSIIGQMNARGVEKPTSDLMQKTLGVYRGIMEAWAAGDMFEIEIHRFDMGVFRKEMEGVDPTGSPETFIDLDPAADDLPF